MGGARGRLECQGLLCGLLRVSAAADDQVVRAARRACLCHGHILTISSPPPLWEHLQRGVCWPPCICGIAVRAAADASSRHRRSHHRRVSSWLGSSRGNLPMALRSPLAAFLRVDYLKDYGRRERDICIYRMRCLHMMIFVKLAWTSPYEAAKCAPPPAAQLPGLADTTSVDSGRRCERLSRVGRSCRRCFIYTWPACVRAPSAAIMGARSPGCCPFLGRLLGWLSIFESSICRMKKIKGE